jgi:hypothetical protein
MHPTDFIEKHNIELIPEEQLLCDEAIRVMENSVDVHHDASHIHRMLGYLDEFMATEEYALIADRIDLNVVLIACLWHDCWRSTKDPRYVHGLIWYTLYEGFGATSYFARAAQRVGLDETVASPIRYAIRKHSFLQMTGLRTMEAKLLSSIDAVDHYSMDRLEKLERKYLIDHAISKLTLRLAKFSIRAFLEREHRATFFFKWSEMKIAESKVRFRKRVMDHLYEYETLLSKLKNRPFEEYSRYLQDIQDKYVFNPERTMTNGAA